MTMLGDAYLRPVLVVDDSEDDFDTVLTAAQRGAVRNRLIHADSAAAARNMLAAEPHGPFAFMLLDCSMPGEDGLSLLKDLRQQAGSGALPVVVLTGSTNARDRNAFYAAGANAYHVKNVVFEDSLATLQHVLHYWLHQVTLPTTNALSGGKLAP